MQVFVNNIEGETISLNVENSVNSVKEMIEEIEGIPPMYQRLVYEGREIEDGRSLEYYNVQEQSTIHMSLALTGGANGYISYLSGEARLKYLSKRLAEYYLVRKKICRKCYCRLPYSAMRCRNAKCGKTFDIRDKNKLYPTDRFIKKMSDWNFWKLNE